MNEPGTPHLPVKSLSQSLTRRVLLLSLIGVVGLGSTIALGLMITLDQVQARMDGINAQAMSVFDRFFLEIESDLRATSEGLAARGDKNAALLQLRTRNSAFLDVFLISPEGVILAQRNAVGRPKQTKIEQPAWLESPPPFGKVVIGPVRFEGQTPYVDMAITATDDIGLPAGFLLVRVDLTELWNTTLDIKVGDTGYAYVADSAGQLVAFRNRRLLETGSNLEKLVGRTPQAIAASRPSFYTGLSGEPVLASAQPLKTVSWFAIVEQPVREALTPFMLPALFLLIALVVVGLLLYNIIRFTRVRIVSPLLALCDAVVQIADGQLKQSVEVRHDDELGQLARSFNSMVGQLQQAFAALQDRIAELHQTQESLRESEAIFASFMEYSPVYVFFKDKEIRTLRLSKNYEQMLGMPISQMLGKTMDELFPSDLAKSMVEDDLRILNQGQRVDIVEEFGGRVYETTKFPIFKDGQPNMLAGFTVDITERKRAEESLRQSEEKYRSIFENAIEGIFQSTPQGRFLRVNPAVVKMFGYATAAEMVTEITHIGQQIYARPEDREKIVELLKTEGFIHDYEVECRRKDGSSFWVSDNMYTVRDPDGAILYFEGALLDITERKRAEEALKRSEEKFAKAFRSSPDLIVLTSLIEGRIVEANDRLQKITGYTRDEIIDKTTSEIQTWVDPSQRDRYVAQLLRDGYVHDWEVKLRFKSGNILDTLLSGEVIELQDGKYILGTIRDITERKRTEDKLVESERLLRDAQRVAQIGHWSLNPKTLNVEGSEELFRIFGLTRQESTLDAFASVVHPEDREYDLSHIRRGMETGQPWDIEHRVLLRDGTLKWVHAIGRVQCNESGQPTLLMGTVQDITERKQAEEALKESEELLRSIFVSTPDSITVADLHGRIILCNQATATIHGYSSPEQLVGKSFYELTADQDRERAREGMKQVTMYGIVKDVPFIGLKGSGEKFDGELSVSLLQDSLGRPSGFVGITKDITERKRAEDALRESEVAFRELADSITDVFFAVDRDLRLTYWNKATEFLTRISAQDALGKSVLEVFRDTPKTQAIVSAYRDVLATQKAQVFVSDHVLGEKLHVFEISAYPSKRGISVFIKDITERKQAEEALKESERRWRFAIEASQGAYYEHSADMQQGWFSPRWAELYGYAPEEIPPLGSVEFPSWWEAHLHPDDRTRITNAYQAFLDGRTERYHYECRVRHKTGQWIWGEAIGIALQRDAEGKVTYVAGVAFNITERKQAEEQVKRSLAEKETLLRELYHRTKNNMQVIISLLKLQAADAADARLQAILRDIQNRIRSMALVHQKLYEAQDLSRVNLKEYMGELARLLMSSYEVQPGQITLVSETEDVFVLIDTAIPCGLILNELISNALRHAFPAGRAGEIRLQLGRTPDGEIHLRVADDGVGLPPGFDVRQDRRLGLQNIFDLGEYQLKGQVDFNTEQGVSCQISFRDNLYQPRV